MHCPFCHFEDTKVIDSRLAREGDQVRRRRECLRCKERFTTYEAAERSLPRIVKRDGRREPFDEEKLRKGLTLACEKRPVATETLDSLISRIIRKALALGKREVRASSIGDWAMQELRAIDQVAYVRFASVYRSFEDVRAFKDLIERVEKDLDPEMRKGQLSLIIDDAD
ncbi:MAG: transcriptional regulator NrdR [Gammaproteobacteria bacterium]|nr:transcriptional regulator NrdR [Gammaproteobacteria bacterium]MDE0411990.1 transcriptional regulator NrdR [Gammaproteobacteria bacterium]